MSRKLLIAAIAGACAAILAFVLTRDDRRERHAELARAADAPRVVATHDDVAPVPSPPRSAEPTPNLAAADEVEDDEADARVAASPEGTTFTGRVVLPPGTPADELVTLRVVVLGASEEVRRVDVASDGSFRFVLRKGEKRGRVELDARFVHVATTIRIDARRTDPIVIEPKLGAWVRGRLGVPAGRELSEIAGVGLRLQSEHADRSATCDAHGAFEFRGVEAESAITIDVLARTFAPSSEHLDALRPGELREVEIALRAGARATGRVIDARGQPVASAQLDVQQAHDAADRGLAGHGRAVGVAWPADETAWWDVDRSTQSESDGSFTVLGLPEGALRIVANGSGFLGAVGEPFEAVDGRTLDGVVLALDRGAEVGGTVRWPDGSAAGGVAVHVEPVGVSIARGERPRASTDDQGRFGVSGLEGGPFRVFAEKSRDEAGVDARTARKAPKWCASVEPVADGTFGVELVLAPPISIRGRIVDDLGRPLSKFRVHARPLRNGEAQEGERVSQAFETTDGVFDLARVHAGFWRVGVHANGYVDEAVVDVPVPGDPIELVCTRGATVRGRVVDASGRAIARASVSIDWPRGASGVRSPNRGVDAVSRSDGSFAVAPIAPGEWRIRVAHADFAHAHSSEIVLAAGQELEGVVLTMSSGGRIEGVTHFGEPGSVRAATADRDASGVAAFVADGPFALDRLPAGRYEVVATTDGGDRIQRSARVDVEVVAGSTARVALGAPLERPILLSGRVTSAGEPVGDVVVRATRRGSTTSLHVAGNRTVRRIDESSTNDTDASGRYRMTLDAPGDYELTVETPDGTITRAIAVPDAPSFVADVALPSHRIAGRVVDEAGEPLREQPIVLTSVPGVEPSVEAGQRTERDGTFAFEGLPAGRYSLETAHAYERFDYESYEGSVSSIVREVDSTDRGSIEDLVIVVGAGARVAGTLRGEPDSPDGTVAAYDASGRRVAVASAARDRDGELRFVLAHVPPGRVRITAGAGTLASRDAWVELVEGQELELSIDLAAQAR